MQATRREVVSKLRLGNWRVRRNAGKEGEWEIIPFSVSKQMANLTALRAMIGGSFGRGHVPERSYTRLTRGGDPIMSDTPDEIRDLLPLAESARGDVLVVGLGLGVAVEVLGVMNEVRTITIVEKSSEVIDLVWHQVKNDGRARLVKADAFNVKFEKELKWDTVWLDIWDDISDKNLEEMEVLKRRFKVTKGGFVGAWADDYCG